MCEPQFSRQADAHITKPEQETQDATLERDRIRNPNTPQRVAVRTEEKMAGVGPFEIGCSVLQVERPERCPSLRK